MFPDRTLFDDSLFSSAPTQISKTKKWATTAAIAAQIAILALILIAPLLHPATLAMAMTGPTVILANPPRPIPKPIPVKPAEATHTSTTPSSPSPAQPAALLARSYGHIIPGIPPDEPSLAPIGSTNTMGTPTGIASGIPSISGGGATVVKAASPQKVRLSSGVTSGMLLTPIHPTYPPIARAAHQEGTVVLTATIDKTGKIVGLQVTSGPAMLRSSALEAVSAAHYKPYLLNGDPTEVETTISVIFHLGS
ncbi:energy transducer TonB [Granulicella tundricola]|uniref:TonB family protein n=1 Tax=Granulicella tundricola (strain ATCC BAA-1859 / DSM 23138 / MP5ACTX9) TaxID=1198114 RepID=E8X5F3_GRATM|nr:energy transducer TonB [Granulicella tundricola]ADW69500.1 TonB family protein [Granulicella tundricola MP5ACTX9]